MTEESISPGWYYGLMDRGALFRLEDISPKPRRGFKEKGLRCRGRGVWYGLKKTETKISSVKKRIRKEEKKAGWREKKIRLNYNAPNSFFLYAGCPL
ncbi:hypothetical protein NPIL_410441 [Nephila pilipes]|uniref:Uncharacterized protein n=1 Tax=Nephila pilipes TaxID=299642 RepID=A0A8X6NGB3_NEPPI|nr:hypothetical protein NPIL_410441 [Nephila pilipes]